MAKRTATSDLNHDNWNEELETEEAGTFKTASADLLQKRAIKVARRRMKTSENNDAGKTVFASFTGFKPTVPTLNSTTSTSKPSFSFLGNSTPTSNSNATTNGTSTTINEVSPQQKYLSNLQQLNKSVSDWIKCHVDKNPACILTPVFKDYEKYLKELQDERDTAEKAGSTAAVSAPKTLASFSFVSSSTSDNKLTINVPTTSQESDKKNFSFVDSNLNTNSTEASKISQSIFGMPKDSDSGTGKSPLLQGDSTNKTSTPSIFGNFKSSSSGSSLLMKPDPAALMVNPFTSALSKPAAGNGSAPTSSSENKEEEEEEESDEPPKVEVKPIEEKGSVFSIRCKVFVKKDSNYKEKGVGTLYIKKVDEEKHQLLVRAETVLGNVLLNVLLSSGIPTQRVGKNNVMLVCLPTPQDPPPPTPVLLRVKTAEEADELLNIIEKYKPTN